MYKTCKVKTINKIIIGFYLTFFSSLMVNLNVDAWELNIDYKKETQELCGWTQAGHYDTITGAWVDCYVRGQKYYLQFFGSTGFNSSTFLYGIGASKGQVSNDRYDCKKISSWPNGDYLCTKKAYFRTSDQVGVQMTHDKKSGFFRDDGSDKWQLQIKNYSLNDFKGSRKTFHDKASTCSFSDTDEKSVSTNGASLLLMGKNLPCSFSASKSGTYTVYVTEGDKYFKYSITVSNGEGGKANSCGLEEAVKKYSSKEWTIDDCNALKDSDYYSVWDSSNNCCRFSRRSSTPTPEPYDDKKTCEKNGNYYNSDSSKAGVGCYVLNEANCNIFGFCWENGKCNISCSGVNVTFNAEGLSCDAGYSVPAEGSCSKNVPKGTSVNVPSSSSNMIKNGRTLIGWTKDLYDGNLNCNKGVISKDSTYTVNSNTNFYACYEEYISGYRYLQNNYLADGGSVDYNCGQAIWVEYCTKESGVDYCYYYENATNTYRKVYRDKLADDIEAAKNTCDSTETSGINTYKYATKTSGDYKCGEALYITNCNDKECTYTKISKFDGYEVDKVGTISVADLKNEPLSNDEMKKCDNSETNENTSDDKKEQIKKCDNTQKFAIKGTEDYTLCFDKKNKDNSTKLKNDLKNVFHCDTKNNYYLVENSIKAYNNLECNDYVCTRTYSLTCKKKDFKPKLTVTSGIIQGNEKTGKITVKATATSGRTITDYYYSADYKVPTKRNLEWTPVTSSTFTIESTPGVVYIWVMDDEGNISKAVTGVVIDTVNTDTTLQNLTLYDSNDKLQTPESTMAFDTKNVKDSKYVMMSNDLSKDSNVIADAFNPYDMEYKLEVDSPTITVYATLTSTDSSYVDGYEPRTVNLDYGVNTVLIKIQNKEGKVRTYTILVTRKDTRTSDNTLRELSVSEGSINFNSNVTDYKVIIPKSTTNVEVKSTIGSNKASYISGYEPGNVSIIGDTTVKLIKVKSETGSTRTYVITFVKEGTDIITKESLQLSDLVIPDVYVPFEDGVANYSLTVDYEKDLIDINSVLKDVNSIVSISIKRKNDKDYSIVSDTGISLDEGENFIEIKIIDNENDVSYYRLTIIRKEFGLGISDDTALKELRVLGYDIKFKPDKKDYTVRIKQEKSLVITAVPNSNRAEVFIRGNDELTGLSTVRVKVVAENGKFETYSIDIKKDAFNKTIEIASIVAGVVIILVSSGIIIVKKKAKARREYFEE